MPRALGKTSAVKKPRTNSPSLNTAQPKPKLRQPSIIALMNDPALFAPRSVRHLPKD